MPQVKKQHKGFFTSQNLQSFFSILQIRKPEFQSNRVVWKNLSTELSHRKGAHTQVFLYIPRLVFWANVCSFVMLFHPQLSNQKVDEWLDQLVFFLWFLFSEEFLYKISCISTSFCLVQLKLFALLSHQLLYLLWFRQHCLGFHILRFHHKSSTTVWNQKGKCSPYNAYSKCTVGNGVKQTGPCVSVSRGT